MIHLGFWTMMAREAAPPDKATPSYRYESIGNTIVQ